MQLRVFSWFVMQHCCDRNQLIEAVLLDYGAGKPVVNGHILWDIRRELPSLKRREFGGSLDGSAVECLPSAQGLILRSRDPVPHSAPCGETASISWFLSQQCCITNHEKNPQLHLMTSIYCLPC